MVLQVETKNATFGSIIDERMKQHHLPVSKHSSLKVVFWAIPSFGHIKNFNVSLKVFELMASALVYIKCQAIFYNTARDAWRDDISIFISELAQLRLANIWQICMTASSYSVCV